MDTFTFSVKLEVEANDRREATEAAFAAVQAGVGMNEVCYHKTPITKWKLDPPTFVSREPEPVLIKICDWLNYVLEGVLREEHLVHVGPNRLIRNVETQLWDESYYELSPEGIKKLGF